MVPDLERVENERLRQFAGGSIGSRRCSNMLWRACLCLSFLKTRMDMTRAKNRGSPTPKATPIIDPIPYECLVLLDGAE